MWWSGGSGGSGGWDQQWSHQQWSHQQWSHQPWGKGEYHWVPVVPVVMQTPMTPMPTQHQGPPQGYGSPMGKGLSPSPAEGGKAQGKGKDKGPMGKGEAQGKGKDKAKGEASAGQKGHDAGRGQGSVKSKGVSPSSDEGEGQGKGKGKGKAKTPEEARDARKKRQKRISMTDRVNAPSDGQFRMPWYHRRGRVQPGKLRKVTEGLVSVWKKKRDEDGEWYKQAKSEDVLFASWKEERGPHSFKKELEKLRRHMKDAVFGHLLEKPRIIEDVTASGQEELLSTPLWPGGPAWKDLPGNVRPDVPSTVHDPKDRKKVRDLWLMDFNPRFWEHMFGDCPLSTDGGKDLCSGPRVAETAADLLPKCSWLRFHGTGLSSAMVAVSMNMLNKSELDRGRPSPNDPKNPPGQEKEGPKGYECAVQRGVYTAADWSKACGYAIPYAPPGVSKLVVHPVLLLRIPGSLEKVGAHFQVAPPGKRSYLFQHDLEGKEYQLSTNWATVDIASNLEEVMQHWQARPQDIPWEQGVLRWASSKGKTFETPKWRAAASNYRMRVDPELQHRRDRQEMQTKAQGSHLGEERWCNTDQYFHEYVSSSCAVVGMFLGYSVILGKATGDLTGSRIDQSEASVDWSLLPPLCRADDVEARNIRLEEKRQKEAREAARAGQPGSSGEAREAARAGEPGSSGDPAGGDSPVFPWSGVDYED